ncbi:MAG: hypothetical protein ACRDTE_29285 [Pseudonocardiaceae bacterium]
MGPTLGKLAGQQADHRDRAHDRLLVPPHERSQGRRGAQTVLPFDTLAARTFGVLKASLERSGTPLAEPDLRIASIALTRGLILVTRNVRHFQRGPDLTVENGIDGT